MASGEVQQPLFCDLHITGLPKEPVGSQSGDWEIKQLDVHARRVSEAGSRRVLTKGFTTA